MIAGPKTEPEPRDPRGRQIGQVGNVLIFEEWDNPLSDEDRASAIANVEASQNSSLAKLTGKAIAQHAFDSIDESLIETETDGETL